MYTVTGGTKARFFIGVDGGGTSCRARIVDAEGRVLGSGMAGPAAVRLGLERSLAAVEEAARAAAGSAGLPLAALAEMPAAVGLAGLCRKGVLDGLQRRSHPFRSVTYVSDATIACLGAHGGRDGGIVIVGTGSIGLAIVGGRETRIGGYGFPVSDEGSGADMGLHALRLALRAFDGRMEASGLTRDVMARFGNDAFEVVAWADTATATDYATLAPLVLRHAGLSDPLARQIVRDAARAVDGLVRRLIACGAPRMALLGGLASAMQPWLAGDVQGHLSPAKGDAVDGALLLARGFVPSRK